MNISAISNLLPSVLQSNGNNNRAGNASQISFNAPQDIASDISPAARFLSRLQQLEQTDPAQFQQVISNLVQQLQTAAQTAEKNGNSSQADQLNTLASQFQSAAVNGQTPTVQDLQQAGLAGHHHHGHHHGTQQTGQTSRNGPLAAFQTPASDFDTQNLLSNIFSAATSGSASST